MPDDRIQHRAQLHNDRQHPEDHDLAVWTHFASTGALDKNTMILIDTFLMGLSATALGWLVTHLAGWGSIDAKDSLRMALVSAAGAIESVLAAYLTLVYAGYANRNWASADAVARRRGWTDLLPPSRERERAYNQRIKGRSLLAGISWRFARPSSPEKELAWVFVVFEFLAIVATAAHGVVLIWAVTSSKTPC